jgi:hypothetical protein
MRDEPNRNDEPERPQGVPWIDSSFILPLLFFRLHPFSYRRCFADVIAWLNAELLKNGAEIGYARFLYATRTR